VVERIQPDRSRPDLAHLGLAVEPRDPGRIAAQELGREVAQRADHDGLDQLDLTEQIVLTGRELVRVRVAVVRRPAFERIRNKHIFPVHSDLAEQPVEQLPGLADERQPHPVLVGPGRLPDEHQVGVGVAGPEHDGRPGFMQGARDAISSLVVDALQQLAALDGAPHRADPNR